MVFTDFSVEKTVDKARLSITGVGLYEAYLNGQKAGDEFLTPNFNDYDTPSNACVNVKKKMD